MLSHDEPKDGFLVWGVSDAKSMKNSHVSMFQERGFLFEEKSQLEIMVAAGSNPWM